MKPDVVRYCWLATCLLCAQWMAVSGCALGSYQYGQFTGADSEVPRQVTVKQGSPRKVLQGASDAVTWPARTLLPDRPDRREISPETTERLVRYLEKNDLADVQVTLRDYDPAEQWRRLRENPALSPLSRYTLGTMSVLGYTLLPGPVIGANRYNPYTNTLSINTEYPGLVLKEAAYAKNVRRQALPSAYIICGHVPFLGVWRELDATRDVVAYAQVEADWELEQASYREVFPRVGAAATGGAATLVSVWWGGPVLSLAGSAAGGLAGQTALERRRQQLNRELDELIEGEVTGVVQASHREQAGTAPATRAASARRRVTQSSTPRELPQAAHQTAGELPPAVVR